METMEMDCHGCDKHCHLTVEVENGSMKSCKGQECGTGAEYAGKEVLMEA